MITTPLHVDTFVDTRINPSLIAENREKPEKPLPVTTSSDVAAFVTEHVKDTLHAAGLNVVDGPGALTLSGEIRQFFVTETSTYHSELSLVLHLKDAHGKEIWSGAAAGSTQRFGRSYTAENYYETLSDAVLRATQNLLSNAAFKDAFSHALNRGDTLFERRSYVHLQGTAHTQDRGRHALELRHGVGR